MKIQQQDTRSFEERARDLGKFDVQTSPSAMLDDMRRAAVVIFNTLGLVDGIGVDGYREAAAEVDALLLAKEPVLTQDRNVVISLRRVVPFLARVFGIDATAIEMSDVDSSACREHLRDALLTLLNREGEIRLFAACIRVVTLRAVKVQSGHPGIHYFEVDQGTAETANLVRFLTGLGLKPVEVDMPDGQNMLHLLTF